MLNRLYKWSLYISAFALPVIILSSCSSTKKTTSAPSKIASKPLTAEQKNQVKADYYDASKQRILGNYAEALFLFKQCLIIDPNNSAASFEVGDILEADKKPDSAMNYAKRAVGLEPENVW
jgi:tetratricopeptide (TPR) repeat protein